MFFVYCVIIYVVKIMKKILSKLIVLRKNLNMSQQEVANALDINVIEFLRYENGSTSLNDKILQDLSHIYNISIEDLCNDEYIVDEISQTLTNEIVLIDPSELSGSYKIIDKQETTEIIIRKNNSKKRIIISWIVTFIILILVYLIYSNQDTTKKLTTLDLKRDLNSYLFGNSYGILYYDDNNLSFDGIDYNNQFSLDNKDNITKIEVNENITATLDKDGKLTIYGGDKQYYNVDYNNYYKDISLGKSHLLLIDSNDKLVCVKSSNLIEPCVFDHKMEENNISKVFALEDFSIVVDNQLNIYISNINISKHKVDKPIKQIIGNKEDLWILYEDSSVEKVLGHKYNDTDEFTDIKKLVLLNDALVGLKNDKTLVFDASNNKYDYLNEWSDINDIIVLNNSIIGYSNTGFVTLNDEVETNTKVEGKPENITINVDSDGVDVNFEACINCELYEVSILENNYSVSTNINTVFLPLQQFSDGSVYTISVKGKGKYDETESTSIQFTYYNNNEGEEIIPSPSIIPSVIPTATPIVTPTITPTVDITPTVTPTIEATQEPEQTINPEPTNNTPE